MRYQAALHPDGYVCPLPYHTGGDAKCRVRGKLPLGSFVSPPGVRGCSSMVEPLPSKQITRVRFPSSAPELGKPRAKWPGAFALQDTTCGLWGYRTQHVAGGVTFRCVGAGKIGVAGGCSIVEGWMPHMPDAWSNARPGVGAQVQGRSSPRRASFLRSSPRTGPANTHTGPLTRTWAR